MLPFGMTIPITVPQGSHILEGLLNNPVYIHTHTSLGGKGLNAPKEDNVEHTL
jgi:hypothetical protein